MSPMSSNLLIMLSLITALYLARAQERAPHGLANVNPMAFSPSAYDFFHPSSQHTRTNNGCARSNCSPLPMAAVLAETNQLQENKDSESKPGRSGVTAGGIAGIVLGAAFVVVLAVGARYVVTKRRTNLNRAKAVQPDVGSVQTV